MTGKKTNLEKLRGHAIRKDGYGVKSEAVVVLNMTCEALLKDVEDIRKFLIVPVNSNDAQINGINQMAMYIRQLLEKGTSKDVCECDAGNLHWSDCPKFKKEKKLR